MIDAFNAMWEYAQPVPRIPDPREGLGVNTSHFVNCREGKTNAGKIRDALPYAVCYAFR